jgi:hypothetical protein
VAGRCLGGSHRLTRSAGLVGTTGSVVRERGWTSLLSKTWDCSLCVPSRHADTRAACPYQNLRSLASVGTTGSVVRERGLASILPRGVGSKLVLAFPTLDTRAACPYQICFVKPLGLDVQSTIYLVGSMDTVGIFEAKTKFTALCEQVLKTGALCW